MTFELTFGPLHYDQRDALASALGHGHRPRKRPDVRRRKAPHHGSLLSQQHASGVPPLHDQEDADAVHQ